MNIRLHSIHPRLSTVLAVTGLIGLSAVANAAGMGFSTLDANSDGAVTEQEFNQARAARMAARAAEGRQMRGVASAPQFKDIDTDQDGVLSQQEFRQAHQQRRAQMQPGNQGHVQQNKMESALPEGKGMGQQARHGKANPPQFSDCDGNGDQSITREEFYTARNKRIAERTAQGYAMRGLANAPTFEQIDTNGDARISADEFQAHRKQHGKSHRHNGPRFGQK